MPRSRCRRASAGASRALAGQPLTMEDVLAQTAITYPETYVQSMTGSQIKDMLEDVCDNLFNADPYYQQGGDMVRVGGFAYTCTPAESVGKPDFRPEARQWPHARSRQELQGGGLGLGQRDRRARRCGTWSPNICVRGKPPNRRGAASRLKGVDGNPGIAGQG